MNSLFTTFKITCSNYLWPKTTEQNQLKFFSSKELTREFACKLLLALAERRGCFLQRTESRRTIGSPGGLATAYVYRDHLM